MQTLSSLGIAFIGIAFIFVGVALREYLKTKGKLSIAHRTWIRMAFIFAAVGIGSCFLQLFTL